MPTLKWSMMFHLSRRVVLLLAVGPLVGGCANGHWSSSDSSAASATDYGDSRSSRNRAARSTPGHPLADPKEILAVKTFYDLKPWLTFDSRHGPNPDGLKFNLYLISQRTGRAVHTVGNLGATLHTLHYDRDGNCQRTLACQWRHDLRDVPRTRKEFQVGWVYQPRLWWGQADVLGKEVELTVWYEAPDGRRVVGRTKTLQVPGRR